VGKQRLRGGGTELPRPAGAVLDLVPVTLGGGVLQGGEQHFLVLDGAVVGQEADGGAGEEAVRSRGPVACPVQCSLAQMAQSAVQSGDGAEPVPDRRRLGQVEQGRVLSSTELAPAETGGPLV